MTPRPAATVVTLVSPRLLRHALACIAAALLACACDRPISPAPPPASDPQARNAGGATPKPAANASAKPAAAADPVSLPPPADPPSDAQITARVAAGLRDDPALAGADLTVRTDHGVVSVTGSVRSPEQVAEAEARAQEPTGVMRVDTRLSMTPP